MALQGATSGVTTRSGNWFWVSGTTENILDRLELFDPAPHKIVTIAYNPTDNSCYMVYRK